MKYEDFEECIELYHQITFLQDYIDCVMATNKTKAGPYIEMTQAYHSTRYECALSSEFLSKLIELKESFVSAYISIFQENIERLKSEIEDM